MTKSLPTPVQQGFRWLAIGILAAFLLTLIGLGGWMAVASFQADYYLAEAKKATQQNRLDEARAHLARVLELRPDSAEVEYLAARAARQAGDYAEAKNHLQRSKALGWVKNAVELEEVLLEAQRDPRRFQAMLFDAVERDHPDRDVILEALSRGYLNLFDMSKATHCLDLWLERQPNAVRALAWRGDARERLGRSQDAHDDFLKVVELDPDNVDARVRLAKILLKGRKLDEASGHLELAYQQKPDDADVLRELARCRLEQNRREEAEQLLDRAVVLKPDDPRGWSQRGSLALEMSNLPRAESDLRRAVSLAPFERDLLFNFSRCLHARDKHEEARQWEEKLARVEADLKLVEKARDQALAAPQDPNPRRELGVIFLRNAQDKEGLRWLHNALQCEPNDTATHKVLADYFEKQGQKDLANHHRRLAQ